MILCYLGKITNSPDYVTPYFNSKLEQYSLGIIEVYALLGNVHSNQGPVDLQVEGNQQQSFRKHIYLEATKQEEEKKSQTQTREKEYS